MLKLLTLFYFFGLSSSNLLTGKYCGNAEYGTQDYGTIIFCNDNKTLDVGVDIQGFSSDLYCSEIQYTFNSTSGQISLDSKQPDCFNYITQFITIKNIVYNNGTVTFSGESLGMQVKLSLTQSDTDNCPDRFWKNIDCNPPGGPCPSPPWLGCLVN